MDGTLIATTRNAELQALGTGGQLAVQAWDQITGYLRRGRGAAHAALFAEPNPDANRGVTDWYAEGSGDAPPLESLPPAEREAARAEFTRLYNDVREESEALRRGARENERFLGELLALALVLPATDCLRVVGGKPVLVAWAHSPVGAPPAPELLIGMLSGRAGAAPGAGPMRIVGPPVPVRRRPWAALAAAGAALLLLPLALLVLWADPFRWFEASAPVCVVEPGNAALLEDLRAEEAREVALRAEIARLSLSLGDRRVACPAPAAAPAQPAQQQPQRAAPATPPQPPPQAQQEEPPPPQPPPQTQQQEPPAPPQEQQPRNADADAKRAQEQGARGGRVQIILAWDDQNDLDLSVVCPGGRRIFHRNRVDCGGELDVDRNAEGRLTPRPVESIVFGQEPEHGTYRIAVHNFRHNPPAPPASAYRVTVRQEGVPDRVFSGSATPGGPAEVGTFDVPAPR